MTMPQASAEAVLRAAQPILDLIERMEAGWHRTPSCPRFPRRAAATLLSTGGVITETAKAWRAYKAAQGV
jgi:hypothetical protein